MKFMTKGFIRNHDSLNSFKSLELIHAPDQPLATCGMQEKSNRCKIIEDAYQRQYFKEGKLTSRKL